MDPLDILIDQASEKIERLTEHLVSGGASSFDEYRFICGEIKGLLTIGQSAKDLKRKLEMSDE